MVQNVEVILNRNLGTFQISQRTNNVPVFHVLERLVVGANHENPSVSAAHGLDQVVQVEEVIVVAGQDRQRLSCAARQVAGIRDSCVSKICR